MHVETLINARWVIPVEPQNSYLENYSIAMSDGQIQAILPTQEAVEQIQAQHVIELPQHALMPGLVNAHTHAAMSLFRGLADDMPLMTWLNDHIWPAESQWVHEKFVADGSRLAIAEMLRSGTTCFNDMYFFPDVTGHIASQQGIRATLGLILIDFPSAWAKDSNDYLSKAIAVHDQFRNDPFVNSAFAPHAPYSVSDEPLQKMLTLANELDLPIHMHVHETQDEIEQSLAQFKKRPLQRLNDLGLLNPSMLAVHMTQLENHEIETLALTGSQVIHCPESNLKLASGFSPIDKLLKAGINVALGTDSAASNNNLDMISEMKSAALLAKAVAQDASALPAYQAIEMATLNGAKALGLNKAIGSLVVGKEADIIAIDLGETSTQPVYNPISQIVYASCRQQVTDVWVAGKQQLSKGKLLHMDEAEIIQNSSRWAEKIAEKDISSA